ncbi:MAG: shikimate dehydrogenase [Proteobacteria bacterium]|nr:shikimate dehydrogenase [Pseudomonadota bacterium]
MAVTLDGETRLIPIIGDPIIYVKSPEWISEEFAKRGHKEICVPMQVAAQDLDRVLQGLSAVPNVAGLLVTMPHKKAIYHCCATTSTRSKLLETVSLMRRNPDGSWHGDVLDGNSFVKAQIDNGARTAAARALLLGAGGAGSAIGVALLEAGVRELIVHDIDAERAGRLANVLGALGLGRVTAGSSDPTGCDMVCNATPMGMADGDPLPLDASLLTAAMFVGDVIAGHGETAFLRAARKAGCKTADGDQMVKSVIGMTVDFFVPAT